MLITFKSKAAGDILMYEKHAEPILQLLGKDVQRGIITAAEMPQAVATLEAAIEDSRRQEQAEVAEQEKDARENHEDPPPPRQKVSFSARAYPLLEMLRAAQRDQRDVMWGV